ncbi:TetR family transcriptional regulator [Streptomyces carminius]|uniref:TetR family transcriptional regulator n=1 Tax=Streptomyces carminius TaxID=2665496 RepID=A0A2M8LRB0_9ACTN|nr:TetR family transcriptional regulator [Streptomyces carminius]PJE94498.1 TetR family transcriptional regulator [Streptomyces carminius]
MRDAQATRRRLLDAAAAEFAAHGIAGARVDRISADARVNKAQMYAYYGNKDGLFDAVFEDHVEQIVHAVPMTAEDLPGYATRLYDACLARPELVRLAAWARLERVPTGPLVSGTDARSAHKLGAIAAAQRAGHIDPSLAPADVLSIVTAMALTWSPAGLIHTAAPDEPESEHEGRRRALARTVRRAFAPEPESEPAAPARPAP